MQKLFEAVVDYPLALVASNEEFARARGLDSESPEQIPTAANGWNAFEIWRSRIRLRPGASSLFLPFLEVR